MDIIFSPDGYKTSHFQQFPAGTEFVYSNLTARGPSRIPGVERVVFFGLQRFIVKRLMEDFSFFFGDSWAPQKYQKRMDAYLGTRGFPVRHIEELREVGHLPIRIKALPEGALVPFQVPMLTIENTDPRFFWLTNFLETALSCELWPTCTSATIAFQYRRVFDYWARKTGAPLEFCAWQGHDFSARGMFGLDAAAMSGAAHLLSFTGSDTVAAIGELNAYYSGGEGTAGSVPASEHAVMCAGGEESEVDTFRRLMRLYPTGIVSVVSDTWDFWNVVDNVIPSLKAEILERDGKLVIRPDSGCPEDILCGDEKGVTTSERKGLVECLWDIFGGTTTATGHRVLDSHIGCIYGDSITLVRQQEILRRLHAKGFASSNVVLGIGSYSYQGVTRDSLGFAIKATHCVINGQPREIYKRPKTDSGKNSRRGLLKVLETHLGSYVCIDGVDREEEQEGVLETVFQDGRLVKTTNLAQIRGRIAENLANHPYGGE